MDTKWLSAEIQSGFILVFDFIYPHFLIISTIVCPLCNIGREGPEWDLPDCAGEQFCMSYLGPIGSGQGCFLSSYPQLSRKCRS